jgi:hypothetical protein
MARVSPKRRIKALSGPERARVVRTLLHVKNDREIRRNRAERGRAA